MKFSGSGSLVCIVVFWLVLLAMLILLFIVPIVVVVADGSVDFVLLSFLHGVFFL
jgi:hypothetical protein